MGCHCRADRSFFWRGQPFPICARCTGELIGFLLAAVCFPFFRPTVPVLLILLLPATVDGMIQRFTRYESTNLRRVWTGLLLGYGLMSLLLIPIVGGFRWGYDFGLRWAQSR